MRFRKAMAILVTGALFTGLLGSTALASSHNLSVPAGVYGIRKALTKVADQAKDELEKKLQNENPGLSREELKKQVEQKVQEEIKVVVQTKLETAGVTDVKADHWAAKELAVLVEVGFVQPDAAGNVKPDEGTTVDETAALFAKVLGVADPTDDVVEAAKKAEKSGLVKNRTDIQRDMTRIEVAYMLLIALGIEPKYEVSAATVPFKDFYLMSADDWAVVTALFEAGIFKGFEDRTFRPNNILTKAQIALLVDRVLAAQGQ